MVHHLRLRLVACLLVATATAVKGDDVARLAAPASPSFGREASLGDTPTLVFAASRRAETLAQAPASVTVVTRAEIDAFGWRTIADVLASTCGFSIVDDRNYTTATVRGLVRLGDLGTRILLMLNGHRLNGGVEDQAFIGTEGAIDLNTIERVEILRGPGSVLYGTNALYAVVNLVTRRGSSINGVEVTAEASSFATREGGVALGGTSARGLDVFLSGSAMKSRGADLYFPEFDNPATNHGRAVGVNHDENARGYAQVAYGDFSLQASYSSRTKQIPTASYGTVFDDPREVTRDSVATAGASYEHAFSDLSRVWGSLFFDHTRYDGTYPYPDVLSRETFTADVCTLEGQYLRYVGDHALTAGGELRRNARLDQTVFNDSPREVLLNDHRSLWAWAVFGEGRLELSSRAQLTLGLRYDNYETFGGTTNPRAALVFALAPESSLKILYGKAFRAPNAYELYYSDGGQTQKASPDLKPEALDSYELALEQKLGPRLRGSVSLYRVNVRDLITLTTDPTDGLLIYRNADRVHSTGVELEVSGRVGGPLSARLAYAYQDAVDKSTGSAPPGSPHHLGHLGIWTVLPGDAGTAGLEISHVGSRPARDGSQVDRYTVANVFLRFRPWRTRNLEVTAGASNVLDQAYGDPGGDEHIQLVIPRDGRVYRVGLCARLDREGKSW